MQPSNSNISITPIIDVVLAFLHDEILDGGAHDLDEHTPLLAYGVLDSLSIVSVLSFIRDQFDVEVAGDDIVASNFETVLAISFLIERLVIQQASLQRDVIPSQPAVHEQSLMLADFN